MAIDEMEKARLEELFKYFQAASHAIGLAENDIDSEQHYDPNLAQLSLDPVLNALCQLGTHRLACDRAFISLIDDENQYVVSEMTKSISLYDTNRHAPEDELCMGARPLDLFAGVCAGTMPAFTGAFDEPNKHHLNTANIFADNTRYIINDFTLEPMYKNRPYVTGFPHMRWYAEVPIRSRSGYVIGTYAVLDSKPRSGIDQDGYLALTDIAASIMRHLEMVKMKDDHARTSRLLHGLNSLIQGEKTELRLLRNNPLLAPPRMKSAHEESDLSASEVQLQEDHRQSRDSTAQLDQFQLDTSSREIEANVSERGSLAAAPGLPDTAESLKHGSITQFFPNSVASPDHSVSVAGSVEERSLKTEASSSIGAKDFAINNDIQTTIDKSAAILRQSMDLDGVIFFDATPRSMSSRVPDEERGPQGSGSLFIDQSSDWKADLHGRGNTVDAQQEISNPSPPQHHSASDVPVPQTWARKLAEATIVRNSKASSVPSSKKPQISERLHRALLHAYPHGHIFMFHQSEPEVEKPVKSVAIRYQPSPHTPAQPKPRTRLNSQKLRDAVRVAFPSAKSVIFITVWNSSKDKWSSSCIGWSSQEKRVFEFEDVSYFKVFANSMMAKIARLELMATDQAKSDFISCISHELRSPLHGILGSAELLREGSLDADQHQIIDMVEKCGRTLLDTMNHVLDYSKINTAITNAEMFHGQQHSNHPMSEMGIFGEVHPFDLSILVEESIESLVAGYQHSSATSPHSHKARKLSLSAGSETGVSYTQESTGVIVILNMERNSTWTIRSEPGAWRRCILNVLGNALKYTESGFVQVSLQHLSEAEQRDSDDSPNERGIVSLSISDTGRGISQTYLRNHLYRPFVQENPLSSGTGLGLSIVKNLVDELGGWMDIQSEVDVGTEISLNIPATFVENRPDLQIDAAFPRRGLKVCLLGFGSATSNPSNDKASVVAKKRALALRNALATHLGEWLNMNIYFASSVEETTSDIIVVDEDNLNFLEKQSDGNGFGIQVPPGSILIVLCRQPSVRNRLHLPKSHKIQFFAQPFGPWRLAALVARAIKQQDTAVDAEILPVKSQTSMQAHSTTSLIRADEHTRENRRSSEGNPSEAPPNVSKQNAESTTKSTPHVLLVDDNDVNLKLLARCMEGLKLPYATASNGAEAVEVFKTSLEPFDYIFMDVSMPIMDGFAATRAIRDHERHVTSGSPKPAQIVAMTGLGSDSAQQEGVSSGMNLFLTKPVQMKTVRSLILGGGIGVVVDG